MTFVLPALALVAASSRSASVERAIEVRGPGRISVVLDRDVYDVARPDLGDLRVLDQKNRAVPFVLDLGLGGSKRESPRLVERSFTRGRSETAVLDFGTRSFKKDLGLSLSGDNFRRRVVVEASDDAVVWSTLTDAAYMFAIPPPTRARYETIALPENEARFLRVTVLRGEGDPERFEIGAPWATTQERRERQTVSLDPRMGHEEDRVRRETVVTLELGARGQPFRGIVLDCEDPRFMRSVAIEALWRESPTPSGELKPPLASSLGEALIYRYEEGGRRLESLRLDVQGREQKLRLRIRNADDHPLAIRGVKVLVPVERVLFEAVPEASYRLTYGAEDLSAPSFDLARTMGDLDAWAASAALARLGAARPQVEKEAPWSEQHPALLWIGLISAVAVLGLLTFRALRTT